MAGFAGTDDPNSDEVQRFLRSTGDLYEKYNPGNWFLGSMYFGRPDCKETNECWVNVSFQIKLVCFITFIFEILQIFQYFTYYKGYKMKRGFFLYLKYALSILPMVGTILFFVETSIVFGFRGQNCFCRFRDVFNHYTDPPIVESYMCMDSIGSFYNTLIMVKFIYVCINLILIVYRISIQ